MKKSKKIFIQDCGIFSNEIIVSAGYEKKEILKFLKEKKRKIRKEAIKWIEEEERAFEVFAKNMAVTAHNNGMFMLLFKPFEDSWGYWETLIHELNHITHFLAKDKMLDDEMEARAYLQEYLFHKIRRKLMSLEN